MGRYQVVGLLVVAAGLAFVAGLKVGEVRGAAAATRTLLSAAGGGGEDCCAPAPKGGVQMRQAPKIPTGSGLPCLVEFGSDECDSCKRMETVLDELTPRLKGKADVLRVDTDMYPVEAQRWRLRLIPTQIIVGADGKELVRHEGYLPAEELLARLRTAGVKTQ